MNNQAVTQSLRNIPIIFVHSKLDDLGLTADEFRIYCHLARRANSQDVAWPSVYSIAEICKISHNTVRKSLKSLASAKLIVIVAGGGIHTNRYHLTESSEWDALSLIRDQKEGNNCPPIPNEGGATPTKVGRGALPNEGGHPYQSRETKVIHKGNPIRESKDAAPKTGNLTLEGERRRDDVPSELDTPEFRETWKEFKEDRRARRKPVTPAAETRLFAKMKAWGPAKAIQAMNKTIESSWTGLFDPDERSKTLQPAKPADQPIKFTTAKPRHIPTPEEIERTRQMFARTKGQLAGVPA